MSKFSENESLNREHSFYQSIVVIAHLILALSSVVIFAYGIKSLDENGFWSFDCLVKLILAAVLFWYYYHSVHNDKGIFYALHLWEQSLLNRRADDEFIRAYYRGEKIFKDFREAEVFDGRIFPKPGGTKLTVDDDESKPQEHK